VKLVPYDMASKLTTCAQVNAYMGSPFDGSTPQAKLGAGDIRNDFTNNDMGLSFPRAGKWGLCYSANGVQWEKLPTAITVLGAETTEYKFWCAVSLLNREICHNSPKKAPGCECMGKIEGVKLQSVRPYEMTTLGLPDPVTPAWKITLTETEKECGIDSIDPFQEKTSEVVNYQGYEVHNFGKKTKGTTTGVWKVCYCVGFDADNGAGTDNVVNPCYREAPEDFVQTIGRLITIDTRTKYGSVDVTVYPTLRFSLEIQCGSAGAAGTDVQGLGGCTTTSENRYKIIEKRPENDLLYFDASAGCRFLREVTTTVNNMTTIGGHLGPNNCENATLCYDRPEVLGPKIPTWMDVQIDASYENGVMISTAYDVCYCDGNCQSSMNWFKAGEIRVEPVTTMLSEDGLRAVAPVVNTNYYIVIQGSHGVGAWSTTNDYHIVIRGHSGLTSWHRSGTREMKVLRDTDGQVDKTACLSSDQRDVISGHRLVSGNTDYTDPSETILNRAKQPIGQRYGAAAPNIKILEAGWYAICYCDSDCKETSNWSVFGRVLVSGPILNQEWTRYSGAPFAIDVKGWRLSENNRLRILSTANELADCRAVGQSDWVHGPDGHGELLGARSYNARVIAMAYDPAGTEITFSKQHRLKDGDRISLSGVNVPKSIPQNHIFNTDHEVFVSCDDVETGCYKVLIPVRFPPSLVELETSSIFWIRSSVQTFSDVKIMQASPKGRGYVVCWSAEEDNDEAFVGQPGKIIVKDPIEMSEASMGLTTVQPNVPSGGAPIVISFKTGDVPWYAQADGQLQLKIAIMSAQRTADGPNAPAGPYTTAMEPRDYALSKIGVNVDYDEVSEASQAICGRIFMELWSEDPMGFPQPDGCWIDEDNANVDQPLLQLNILFGQRNHLKKLTKYIIVINAQVMPELEADFPPDGLVYIWSMDDAHTRPFDVVELGRAYPRPVSRVPRRDARTRTDPQFHPIDGFKILPDQGGAPFKDLSNVPTFSFSLRAKTSHPIVAGSIIRVFLHPLTQWDITTPCPVTMVNCPAPDQNGTCGPLLCEAEAAIGGRVFEQFSEYPVNIMKITLPGKMSDITDLVSHTVSVGKIAVPPGGLMPQVVTAELMNPDQVSPDYWGRNSIATGGARIYVRPKVIAASIVAFLGDGNSSPFRGDENNILYFRLVMGTTLWAEKGGGITITIKPPEGYTCAQETEGVPVPNLGVLQGVFPSTKGKLGTNCTYEAYWANIIIPQAACQLVFREHMVLYAGSVVFASVRVTKPLKALTCDDPNNKWEVIVRDTINDKETPRFTVTGEGVSEMYNLESPGYGATFSVLGDVSNMCFGPTNGGPTNVAPMYGVPTNFAVSQKNALPTFFKLTLAVVVFVVGGCGCCDAGGV